MPSLLERLKGLLARPGTGEATRPQTPSASMFGLVQSAGQWPKPEPGTFDTYRQIAGNPTIALAQAIATTPVMTAEWSIEADDGVPDDRVQFIEEQIKPLWQAFMADALRSLDYGFQAFEEVWELDGPRLILDKLKALRPDKTQYLSDMSSGTFAGIEQSQDKVILPPNKCLWLTYGGEAGNPYGRSRHENVRATAWTAWQGVSRQAHVYGEKVARIIPVIKYAVGETRNEGGADKDNSDIAVQLMRSLAEGNGIVIPKDYERWAGDLRALVEAGVDIDKLYSWSVDLIEVKGNHGGDYRELLRYWDALLMRGWLVPERAGTEGQYGTKAEAATHSATGLVIADLTFKDIVRAVNRYVVNRLLVYNFGLESKDTVRLVASGLDPRVVEWYRQVLGEVLKNPMNRDLLTLWTDIDGILDTVGWPKGEDIVQPELSAGSPPPGKPDDEQASEELRAMARQIFGNKPNDGK